ncbi:hypothetical protein RB195_011553 [Necator americanus]|uniref:Uncharacterized protein n=1 Tax=Necator americanus TaxID=51031 RepID=A0ABR1D2X4_NECAM
MRDSLGILAKLGYVEKTCQEFSSPSRAAADVARWWRTLKKLPFLLNDMSRLVNIRANVTSCVPAMQEISGQPAKNVAAKALREELCNYSVPESITAEIYHREFSAVHFIFSLC